MSVRKNLVLAAAGVVAMGAASMTLAGGGDSMAAPAAVPSAQFQRFAYAELGGGYTITNYANYNGSAKAHDDNGGFGFGGALGYQFMPNFAIEAGASHIPTFDQAHSASTSYDVKSWMAYGAARINAAVNDKIGVFGKVGYGYRHLESGSEKHTSKYWKPVAGLGVSYDVMSNLYVTAQYMYMLGDIGNGASGSDTSHGANAQKDLNMFTLNLGYKLNM